MARPLRPLTYYTVNVFFVVTSTTLLQLRQLHHIECEVDFELVRMPQQTQGNHVFYLSKNEMSNFKNRKYLQKKLINYLKQTTFAKK